ncbi:hypothetical protein P5774_28140, partial [Bacillus tropicus]|uniref:hypothetical protein n=1 Tax=Bacillus tropicus TaxID=2026188 RepID=UPI002406F925
MESTEKKEALMRIKAASKNELYRKLFDQYGTDSCFSFFSTTSSFLTGTTFFTAFCFFVTFVSSVCFTTTIP